MRSWSKDDVESAKELLAKCRTVGDAASIIGTTTDALQKAFRRHGAKPPFAYVGRNVEQALPQMVRRLGDYGPSRVQVTEPTEPVKSTQNADPFVAFQERSREQRLRAEQKDLLERLREAEARNAFVDRISAAPKTPSIERRETRSGMHEAAAVVLASDWHVEEVVRPEAVAGRNEYNLEIATARSRRFFDGVRWLVDFNRSGFIVRDVLLWLGGDFISGYIHPELAESNELSPVESVLFVRDLLADGINHLLADQKTERLVIPCSYGNHGRSTEKRRIKTGAQNSYEWLLYNVLAKHFEREPRVEFVIDQSAHQYVEVFGRTLHFHHGDDVRFNGGVGGLAIPLMKRVPMWDRVRYADVHCIGHYHQLADFGRAVVNGSLIGYSDFAMSIGAGYEPPQQSFFLFDSKRGKSITAPIWVDARTDEEAA